MYDSTVDSTPSDDMPLAGTSGLDEIPAGAGWVLKGLSAIQRTNATVADDGTAADYSFSINDPYSLDGNRLRLMGSGDYGEDGSTYRTELDNFAQVTAHGSTADGPEYWTAQLKNGLTYEYGNTSDSQILLPGGTDGEIREWLLDKVSDAYGNSYVVTYGPGTSGTVGVAVPMSISWTPSSAGASDYNYTVKFTYSSRASTELITGYVDGQSLSNDTLLHTITVSYNGTVVRYYQLNYTSSSTGTGRSLLGSIDECSDSTMTECLTPTGFSYAGGAPGVGSASGTAVSGATSIIGVYDFDGTGRSDILYNSGGTLYVAFADGSGFTQVNTGVSASGYYVVGDLVGRGIDDILASVNGTWWRYTWDSASNSFSGSSTGIAAPAAGSSGVAVELADVNGDGLPDLITLTTAPIGDESFYSGTISTTLNTSSAGAFSLSGSSTTFETPACGPNDDVACQPVLSTPVDATGDRRQDLVLSVIGIAPDSPAVTNYYTLIPQGDSYTVSTTITGSAQGVKWNDDDCSDFVGGSEVVISACNGNAGQTLSFAGTAVGTVDWNGDGLQDVLVDDNDTLGVYTSTGNGISALAPTSIALGAGDTVVPLNVTGSGLPDIGVENGGMMTYYLHNVVVSLPDLLTAVTDGNGNTITAAYTSISAGAYTMGSGAQDPESNWIGDLWVVQSLTLPDGTGGTYTKTYYYSDARWSRLRGLEGFSSVQTTDSRNQEIRRTSYDLLFPLTGLMSEDDLFQSDGTTPIEKKTYSNTVENLDSTQFNERYLPYAETVTVGTYGVGGSENDQEIKKSETTYTPDQYGYGNFTSIASTLTDEDPDSPFSGDQWQTTTTAQYVDDASTWCLSLPSSIAVAKTAPGGEATITHTTTFNRDGSNCRAVSETQDAGMADFDVTRAFEYDAFGNISQMTVTGAGMSPRTSTYGWGEAGQFEEEIQNSVAHADGYEEKIGYDYALGLKKSDVIESTGGTQNAPPTEWSYDGLGRLTQETFPDGTTLNWSYNSCSSGCYGGMETVAETANATQSSGGAEITDQSTYVDSFGRPVATTKRLMDGSYSLVEQRYDAFGNITQKSAPCKSCSSPEYWTQITYDALKRPTQIESPAPWTSGGEGTTNIAYAGDKTTITNADTEVKTRITDASGALRSITDAEGYEVDFTPDSDGNVSSVADSNGTITARTYDYGGAGDYVYTMSDRALSEGSALQWVYTRDALGDVCSYTDAKGQEFLMRYDGLGRPIERDDGVEGFSGGCSGSATSDETSTQWTWGETPADHDVGELDEAETATADGTYVEQDSYDADGRLQYRNIAIPGDGTYQYSYAYSPTTGLLSELQYPAAGSAAGLALDYGYSYGVLSSVTDASNGTVYWQDSNPVSVNALGESTQDTLGNGIVTQTAFTDVTGWPTRIISGPTAGSASVQNQTFSYDPLGNVIQRQDSNVGLTENFVSL